MIFIGQGALLEHALMTTLERRYTVDCVYSESIKIISFCDSRDINCEQIEALKDVDKILTVCSDRIAFSIDNPVILKKDLLTSGIDFFGIHSGIIPIQRGNPVVAMMFSMLQEEQTYGVSLYRLDEGIDSGKVLKIERFELEKDVSLYEHIMTCSDRCNKVFDENIDLIVNRGNFKKIANTGESRVFSIKDLQKLKDYLHSPCFITATDIGPLSHLLPEEYQNLIIALREQARLFEATNHIWLESWRKILAQQPNAQFFRQQHIQQKETHLIESDVYSARLQDALCYSISTCARKYQTSRSNVLLSSLYVLLSRYLGIKDLAIFCRSFNCKDPTGKNDFSFGTVAPSRLKLLPDASFSSLIHQVSMISVESFKIGKCIGKREFEILSRQSDIQLDFSFSYSASDVVLPASEFNLFHQSWKFFESKGASVYFEIEYDSSSFDKSYIEQLAEHYASLTAQLMQHSECSVFSVDMITELEQHRLSRFWSQSSIGSNDKRCMHHLLEEQCKSSPDKTAVINSDGKQITYSELKSQSDKIAVMLLDSGVKQHDFVALCLPRSELIIEAMLAVFKIGAVVVPIDPSYPLERITYILNDASTSILLTHSAMLKRIPTADLNSLCIDNTDLAVPSNEARLLIEVDRVSPEDLAYVIYTSGSTGKPKGVMVEHGSIVNTFLGTQEVHPLKPSDRMICLASFGSDTALWQLFAPLFQGASVVMNDTPADIHSVLKTISHYEVTIADFVPSLLRIFVDELIEIPDVARHLRSIICGGEALDTALLENVARTLPYSEIFNAYGPTEASCQITYHRCTPQSPITLGKPLPGVRIYILSSEGMPVPIGVPGEIVIGGIAVARGYLGLPEMTREKFIKDPFTENPEARMYKSGDLGVYHASGEIEFLGRLDQQVKINGNRVEVGELENSLRSHEWVRDATIIVKESSPSIVKLHAYVLLMKDIVIPLAELSIELRTYMRRYVPEHMVPYKFNVMEQWPLTPHGKIDRDFLLSIYDGEESVYEVYYEDSTEFKLAYIWKNILNSSSIKATDNFFDIGGNSLLAVRVIAGLKNEFGIELSLGIIHRFPTIKSLARYVSSKQYESFEDIPISTQQLLFDSNLPKNINNDMQLKCVNGGALLLTGVTGFLGHQMLITLLKRTDSIIYCLVRGQDRDHVAMRVRDLLLSSGLYGDKYLNRILAIKCDLSKPDFGITQSDWTDLSENTSAIYHFAAKVNHIAPYASHLDVNIEATKKILYLARSHRKKVVHFASTIDVLGSINAPPEPANHLHCTDPPSGASGYALSKWVADRLVAQASDVGIPTCIYRIGYIGPSSVDGIGNPEGWVELFLRATWKLRCIPNNFQSIRMAPLNLFCDSLFEISVDSKSLGKAFGFHDIELEISLNDIHKTFTDLSRDLSLVDEGYWRVCLDTYCDKNPHDRIVLLGPYLDEQKRRCGISLFHSEQSTISSSMGEPDDSAGYKLLEMFMRNLASEELREGYKPRELS